MHRLKSNVVIALLGTASLVGLVAWGMMWEVHEIEIEPPATEEPPVVSRTVNLVGRQKGRDRWRLQSDTVELKGSQQVFEQGARGWFYGDGSQASQNPVFFAQNDQIQWQADRAQFDADSNSLTLERDVSVHSPDGTRLETPSLLVTPAEVIDVPGTFALIGPEMELKGASGSFNFEFSAMSAERGELIVSAVPPSAEGDTAERLEDKVTIAADRLDYDRAAATAEGKGNLSIKQSDIVIVAPQGRFDRKAAASQLEGPVQLKEPGRILTANRMIGNHRDRVFRFDGNVIFDQKAKSGRDDLGADFGAEGDTRLSASSLTYDTKQGRAVFEGGARFVQQTAPAIVAQAGADNLAPVQEQVTIEADRLDYDRDREIAAGEGDLVIRQGKTVITSPRGTYKRRESQSLLVDTVQLREPERWLQSDRMTGNHRDKIFLFEGNVVYNQAASGSSEDSSGFDEVRQAETVVRSTALVYKSRTEESIFSGPVEFTQKDRRAIADEATITPEAIVLEGNVEIQQIDGDWLARRVETDMQDAVDRPTRIFAERVEIDQETNDARFFERVVIVQAHRAAEGDTATYFDGDQIFELTGESAPALLCDRPDASETEMSLDRLPGREALDSTCRGADRISSSLITLDMENDTFSTRGQSQYQFRIEDEEQL
ncbi:MAG: LptA/OstA family protein [Cyanobacteria bacterium P01_D01_bin.123]